MRLILQSGLSSPSLILGFRIPIETSQLRLRLTVFFQLHPWTPSGYKIESTTWFLHRPRF